MALNLGRPTVRAGAYYGEWHYPPEFPNGWIIAERVSYGWLVRLREGAKPEQKIELRPSDFGVRSQTLKNAAGVALEKTLTPARSNPMFSDFEDLDTARKGMKRLGRMKSLLSAGAKAGAHTGAKAVPGVGELMMVIDAAPEMRRVQREMAASSQRTLSETKAAKNVVGKLKAAAHGAAEQFKLQVSGTARIGAAALVRSDVVEKVTRKNPNYREEIAKMLASMPSSWQQEYRQGCNELSAIGKGTFPLEPTPEQAMQLIGITAGGNPSGDTPTGNNQVPEAVREAAMHGLRLSHKNNYGAWNFIGIARAIQLAIAPGVSDKTRSRMRAYFRRHVKDAGSSRWGDEKHPSRGWMAWLNWGGDPGQAWVAEAKKNPWSEAKIPAYSPCRRCGGAGKLPSFPHVVGGTCFKCNGSGLTAPDWRVSHPDRFELFGAPVLVFVVKGNLHLLVKQSDFLRDGTPMLDVNNAQCSPFLLRGTAVQGWSGGVEQDYVRPPLSALMRSMPDWMDKAYPDETYGAPTAAQWRERNDAWELHRKLGVQIKSALSAHYRKGVK